jgi:hypothetical protein
MHAWFNILYVLRNIIIIRNIMVYQRIKYKIIINISKYLKYNKTRHNNEK